MNVEQQSVNPDKLAEIATSLKTRLSFAVVKLQNGWTGQTLDQIEGEIKAKSARTSPTLSTLSHSMGNNKVHKSPNMTTHRRTGSHPTTTLTASRRMELEKLNKRNLSKKMTIKVPSTPKDSPREKSSEEAAVESLMFLSSPRATDSNSGTFPN